MGPEGGSLVVKGPRGLSGSVGWVHRSLAVKGPRGLSGSVGWVHQLLWAMKLKVICMIFL